jgi:hypothetical protein
MNRTLHLRVDNASAQARVISHVAVAVAAGAGTGALAADRLGRAVEADAAGTHAWLELMVTEQGGETTLVFTSGDPAWLTPRLTTLGVPARAGEAVVVLRRAPLRALDV